MGATCGSCAAGPQILLTPVAAKVGSYPPGTTIVGNELTAYAGGFRAWFELKLSNWDPNGDNVPPLHIWQFQIDDNGYKGVHADPSNPGVDLTPPVIACANNAPCVTAFGEAWASCEGFYGTCKPAYVDRAGTGRPDSWCADTGSGSCEFGDCGKLDFSCGAFYPSGVPRPDAGIEYYGATVVLDIPTGAKGRYTVNLVPEYTFLYYSDPTVPDLIEIPTFSERGFMVNILVGSCCDGITGVCTDAVVERECAGDQRTWTLAMLCDELDPPCTAHPGACCDHDPLGGCTDDSTLAQCVCPTCEWSKGSVCSELECIVTPIPTVGEWGLVILSLLLLTAAKVAFGARTRCLANAS